MYTEKILEAVSKSELFIELNQRAKALYEQHGREASEEEYQALRNMIIIRVMIEDPEVKEVVAQETYKELRG